MTEEKSYRISRFEKTPSGRRFVRIDSTTAPVYAEKFFDEFVTEEMLAEMVADVELKAEDYVEPERFEPITEDSITELVISDEVVASKKAILLEKQGEEDDNKE